MPTAIDLFAGAGGATQGLRDAGFDVIGAVENDADAAETWRLNHPGTMLEGDIRELDPASLAALLPPETRLDLLKACPPCQGFSSLRTGAAVDSVRNDLVLDVLRFVDGLSPRAILLENVPGLGRDWRFAELVTQLSERGYTCRDYRIEASELGVPQRRRRLVLIAVHESSSGSAMPVDVASLTSTSELPRSMTSGAALAALYRQLPTTDPWHKWRKHKPEVTARIHAVPVNGTRLDLPPEHRLACHAKLDGRRVALASYGRVRAGEVAPTMTTRCTTPACGSFIHPSEDRGLSLREAAAFQTFPFDYDWFGSYGSVERQIGNAVPVRMAQVLGEAVLTLLQLEGRVNATRENEDRSRRELSTMRSPSA